MESFEPYQLWLVMAAVAYVGFLLGRTTKGGSSEAREHQRMVEEQEIETAMAGLDVSKLEEIDRHMRDVKKIEAIKVLREATGLGLRLAKMAVERRARGQ